MAAGQVAIERSHRGRHSRWGLHRDDGDRVQEIPDDLRDNLIPQTSSSSSSHHVTRPAPTTANARASVQSVIDFHPPQINLCQFLNIYCKNKSIYLSITRTARCVLGLACSDTLQRGHVACALAIRATLTQK